MASKPYITSNDYNSYLDTTQRSIEQVQADIELLKREKERLEQEQNKLEFLDKLNSYQAKLEQELVDLHK